MFVRKQVEPHTHTLYDHEMVLLLTCGVASSTLLKHLLQGQSFTYIIAALYLILCCSYIVQEYKLMEQILIFGAHMCWKGGAESRSGRGRLV